MKLSLVFVVISLCFAVSVSGLLENSPDVYNATQKQVTYYDPFPGLLKPVDELIDRVGVYVDDAVEALSSPYISVANAVDGLLLNCFSRDFVDYIESIGSLSLVFTKANIWVLLALGHTVVTSLISGEDGSVPRAWAAYAYGLVGLFVSVRLAFRYYVARQLPFMVLGGLLISFYPFKTVFAKTATIWRLVNHFGVYYLFMAGRRLVVNSITYFTRGTEYARWTLISAMNNFSPMRLGAEWDLHLIIFALVQIAGMIPDLAALSPALSTVAVFYSVGLLCKVVQCFSGFEYVYYALPVVFGLYSHYLSPLVSGQAYSVIAPPPINDPTVMDKSKAKFNELVEPIYKFVHEYSDALSVRFFADVWVGVYYMHLMQTGCRSPMLGSLKDLAGSSNLEAARDNLKTVGGTVKDKVEEKVQRFNEPSSASVTGVTGIVSAASVALFATCLFF